MIPVSNIILENEANRLSSCATSSSPISFRLVACVVVPSRVRRLRVVARHLGGGGLPAQNGAGGGALTSMRNGAAATKTLLLLFAAHALTTLDEDKTMKLAHRSARGGRAGGEGLALRACVARWSRYHARRRRLRGTCGCTAPRPRPRSRRWSARSGCTRTAASAARGEAGSRSRRPAALERRGHCARRTCRQGRQACTDDLWPFIWLSIAHGMGITAQKS